MKSTPTFWFITIGKVLASDIKMATKFSEAKNFLILQRIAIAMTGFYAGSDSISVWQIGIAVFGPVMTLFFAIFQIWFCYENFDHLVEFLRGFTPIVTHSFTAFKLLTIVRNRRGFKEILNFLRNAFVNGE